MFGSRCLLYDMPPSSAHEMECVVEMCLNANELVAANILEERHSSTAELSSLHLAELSSLHLAEFLMSC